MTKNKTLSALLLILLFTSLGRAQTKQRLVPDPSWIYGPQNAAIQALPEIHWLKDGRLLIVNRRENQPPLEILDPSSKQRVTLLSRSAALRVGLRLRAALGRDLTAMPRPHAFDDRARQALYEIDGNLFLLDLETLRVRKLAGSKKGVFNSSFSPDGTRVAYVEDNNLHVVDLSSGQSRSLTKDGSATIKNGTLSWVYWEEIFGRQDTAYWWSSDSSKIAFLRSDDSMVTRMTYVDFEPPTPTVYHQRYPKAGTTNPVVRVGVVSVAKGGKTIWVDIPDQKYEYLCRVKWFDHDRQLAVQTMNRSQKELLLWWVNAATGKAHPILKETDPAWVNINDDLHFTKDGQHFLWVSERSGYAHLYRFRLDGKLENAVTSGPWALRSSNPIFWLRKAVSAVDEQHDWVYFTALKQSPIQKQLYRVHLDGTGMQQITRRPGTWVVLFNSQASYFCGQFSSATAPPSLSLFDASGKPLVELAAPRTDLARGIAFSYPKLTTIPTRDGFQMPAMIYSPDKLEPGKKYPVILQLYGGPSAPLVANAWQGWMAYNSILTHRDTFVVTFDNRSATAQSKTLENTILGQMSGDHEFADILDGVRWIKSQPWCDPARVGIWGWSNGAMITLLMMTRSKEFKAGIAVAPVTDWRFYDTKWGETVNKLPQENPQGYEKTNLWKRAKNLHGELLLVHGTRDDNVHIQNTYAFINQLIAAGKMFDLMIYPMRKHGIADLRARIHLFRTMLRFWKRNL